MNIKKKILIAISVFIIAFIPITIMAQTTDEHCYKVVDFRNGIVGIKCEHCGAYYRTSFEGYVNIMEGDDWYISALDVNDDGIINAKDYAKIYNEYPLPTTTTKASTSTTKKTTTTTKRATTSLPQQTTDDDGYNNGVITP